MSARRSPAADLPVFDRKFWDGTFRFTRIGTGALGGKASGLAFMGILLSREIDSSAFPSVEINVPTMAVIATDFFDKFIEQNHLAELRDKGLSDDRIGHAFQQADLPVELVGDLRALISPGQNSACDPFVELARRRSRSAVRWRLRNQDDPQQPVRPGYPLPPTGRSHQVRLCLHLFQGSPRLYPDHGS